MAAHVDVRATADAPPDTVWRLANDPAQWANDGHPVRNLRVRDDTTTFDVTTPVDDAGRSWSYTVERFCDDSRRTVYSRRVGSPDFRYSHVWFGYTPQGDGTELRCVVDFEMTEQSSMTDASMADVMRRALRRNLTRLARAAEQSR